MSEGEGSNNNQENVNPDNVDIRINTSGDDLAAFEREMFPGTNDNKEESPTVDGANKDDNTNDGNIGEDTPAEEPTTEEAEGTDDTDANPDSKPKGGKKSAQERINEVTAARREAERKVEEQAARIAELEAKILSPQPETATDGADAEAATTKVQDANDGRPDPDAEDADGEPLYTLGKFDPEYIADLTRWSATKTIEEERLRTAQEEAEKTKADALEAMQTEWNTKLDAVTADIPDIRDKGQALVGTFEGLDAEYGEYLSSTIMSLDEGPRVLAYLADHLDVAEDIVAQGPLGAALALGRLDAQVSSPKGASSVPTKVTNAPEPPPTAARGRDGTFTTSDDTDDLAAFERKYYS